MFVMLQPASQEASVKGYDVVFPAESATLAFNAASESPVDASLGSASPAAATSTLTESLSSVQSMLPLGQRRVCMQANPPL